VSNRQDLDFLTEISGSEKCLSEAAAAGERTAEASILNILGFFGPLESPLQEITIAARASGPAMESTDLQRQQGGNSQADAVHRHGGSGRRACKQASPAGVCHTDPGRAQNAEDERSAADAQTGPAAALAVQTDSSCTARQRGGRTPEGPADGRTRRAGAQRRTHDIQECWSACRQGRLQGGHQGRWGRW
jgi:hypothetical protein